jgi:hypothetical protein
MITNKNRTVLSGAVLTRAAVFTAILALCFLLRPAPAAAAYEEMLKTSKVRVGDKAPVSESLKKPLAEGKAIVLTLFPNPMQCDGCDRILAGIDEEARKHPDTVFINKGGEDMRGAMDEETIIAKRLYGFVTVGQAWCFFIDNQGVIKKIIMGRFTGQELEAIFEELKGGKK